MFRLDFQDSCLKFTSVMDREKAAAVKENLHVNDETQADFKVVAGRKILP